MAFADAVKQTRYVCGFGVSLRIYDPASDTTYQAKLTTHPQFGDGRDVVILEASSISCAMRFDEGIGEVSDFSFIIANKVLSSLAPNLNPEKLTDLFAKGYTCEGQEVFVSLMILDKNDSVTVRGLWRGICQEVEYNDSEIRISAKNSVQERLNRTIGSEITLSEYSNAAPDAIGGIKPIVFGEWIDEPPDISGWSTTDYETAQKAGAFKQSRLTPCRCTDLGALGSGREFIIANHELKQYSSSKLYMVYIHANGVELIYQTHSVTSGAPSKITLDPGFWIFEYLDPIGKSSTVAPWTNEDNAVDRDLDTYAEATSGFADLRVRLRQPKKLGNFVNATINVVYDFKTTASGYYIGYGLWDEAADTWVEYQQTILPSATESQYETISFTLTTVTGYDDFPTQPVLRVYAEVDDYVRLREVGLSVAERGWHIPSEEGRLKGVIRTSEGYKYIASRWQRATQRADVGNPGSEFQRFDPSGVNVYVIGKGMKDDTGGSYTGTPDQLIETPASIIYWLCARQGLAANTSAPGKVIDARADQQGDAIKAALVLFEKRTLGEVIAEICRHSLLGFTFSPTGLVFGLVYLRSLVSRNLYSESIRFEYVIDAWIGWTALDEIANAIYVHCEYDPSRDKTLALAYCDKNGSDDGYGTDDYSEKTKLGTSQDRYGRREFHLNATSLRLSSAATIRNTLADYLHERRVRLVITTTWRYFDLKPGHIIKLHNDSWLAAGYKYPGSTGGQDGYWEYGGETRYFWVERVTWTPDGLMEIEATERV